MGRLVTGLGAATLVAGAVYFFAGGAPIDAQETGKGGAMPRVAWEYKVVAGQPNEAEFNKLESDGWELVTSYHPAGGPSQNTFKRRK